MLDKERPELDPNDFKGRAEKYYQTLVSVPSVPEGIEKLSYQASCVVGFAAGLMNRNISPEEMEGLQNTLACLKLLARITPPGCERYPHVVRFF